MFEQVLSIFLLCCLGTKTRGFGLRHLRRRELWRGAPATASQVPCTPQQRRPSSTPFSLRPTPARLGCEPRLPAQAASLCIAQSCVQQSTPCINPAHAHGLSFSKHVLIEAHKCDVRSLHLHLTFCTRVLSRLHPFLHAPSLHAHVPSISARQAERGAAAAAAPVQQSAAAQALAADPVQVDIGPQPAAAPAAAELAEPAAAAGAVPAADARPAPMDSEPGASPAGPLLTGASAAGESAGPSAEAMEIDSRPAAAEVGPAGAAQPAGAVAAFERPATMEAQPAATLAAEPATATGPPAAAARPEQEQLAGSEAATEGSSLAAATRAAPAKS